MIFGKVVLDSSKHMLFIPKIFILHTLGSQYVIAINLMLFQFL